MTNASTSFLFSSHNLAVDILVDGGVVGTVFMLILYVELWRFFRGQPVALAAFFAIGIVGLVGSAPAIYPYQFAKIVEVMQFWLILGLFYHSSAGQASTVLAAPSGEVSSEYSDRESI
jgi:O-antigen ligase